MQTTIKPSYWTKSGKSTREIMVDGRYFLAYQANGPRHGWHISEFESKDGKFIKQIAINVSAKELSKIVGNYLIASRANSG